MDNKEIVNFSSFFEKKGGSNLSQFNKNDFNDFFLEESVESEPELSIDTTKEIEKKEKSVKPEPAFDPPVKPEDFFIDDDEPQELNVEDSLGSYDNDKNYTKVKEQVENYFLVYKDKSENFSCDVQVEGAKISETQARLILESDDWTLMFEGEIDRYGKCQIPIKKLNIFEEGSVGKIRLEVIAENTIFIPWEDDFKVKVSKKVTIQLSESMKRSKLPMINDSSVKVNVRR